MIRLGGLGFRKETPPIDPIVSGFVGGDPPPTIGVVDSGGLVGLGGQS